MDFHEKLPTQLFFFWLEMLAVKIQIWIIAVGFDI